MPGLLRLKQAGLSQGEPTDETTQSLVHRHPSARVTWDGVETVKRCIFRNWIPGEEYTEVVTLKNLSGKHVQFTYEVPKTRYFQTIYPRRITLSQGVTFNLPIQFSPLEKQPYVDELIVYINQTPRRIALAGVLPQHRLRVEPVELNFGYCAVQDTQIRSFKLRNIGDLETTIEWHSNEPFLIEPRECVLPVDASHTFTCSFQPQWALVYAGSATCTYGETVCELRLHGIGKYAHIVVHSDDGAVNEETGNVQVRFGDMSMNGSLRRELILTNQSAFRVPFRIESLPGVAKFDAAFRLARTEGTLEPGKRQTIGIKFEPRACEQFYKDYFNVNTQQGGLVAAVVECSGRAIGNRVEINHHRIFFGQIVVNAKASRLLELSNPQASSVARFQILSPPDSPFHFSIERGSLTGDESKLTVIVTFAPLYPMGYYKIVPILVEHQAPILLELIGTCHSDSGKPPVLTERFVANFKRHVARHLALYPFEMLTDFLTRGKLALDEYGTLIETNDMALGPISGIKDERDYLIPPLGNPIRDNYLWWFAGDDHSQFEYVSLSETCFVFDQCSLDASSEWQQSLTVTNLTRGKLTVVWLGPDLYDPNITVDRLPSAFSILPITAEIPPLKSTAFRMIFRPTTNDTFYTKQFEGYAFYKSQRDFTLVPEYGVMLPVQMELACIGNTLRTNHEIVPVCEFDRQILTFPPAADQASVYQTLTLLNSGPIPLIYRFLSSTDETTTTTPTCLTFKPANGFVREGEDAIILVRYKPPRVGERAHLSSGIHQERVIVRLNEREKFDRTLHAFATLEKPRVSLANDSQIHALSTCVGLASETHMQIKSFTRSQLEFTWTLDTDPTTLHIEPSNGSFSPYEEKNFIIIFKPKEEGKSTISARLTCWVGDRTSQGTEIYYVTIQASTRDGFLRASESHRDIGPVALGTSATYDLYLTNGGDCRLRYHLYTKQAADKMRNSNSSSIVSTSLTNTDEPVTLEFISNPEGYGQIDGKAKVRVPCRIHPFSRSSYQIDIFYELLNDNNQPLSEHNHFLCKLTINGVYPHLTFVDALGSQQSASLSKGLLSKAFNLEKMNALLAKEPTANELAYAINPDRQQTTITKKKSLNKEIEQRSDSLPPLEQPEAISFNFNAAPINSAPSEVYLLLENRGDLDTTWSFLFPKDLQCELEYWARTGDFTEDELNEMKLQDNRIFSIHPKKGFLTKGSSVTISLSYKHIFAGQHSLPAIFKVGRGRQIMLNLVGTSVEPGERYVQFYSTVHHLLPVELGAQGAPVQQYELWNGGSVPIRFQVDMSQLEQISAANFGFWVLDCLTPEGVLAPNKSFVTQWVFNPLEAREYTFNIKIDLEECDPALITFIGRGFDKRETTSPTDLPQLPSSSNTLQLSKQLSPTDRLALLTVDRIHFGNVPLFTKQRHITFLRNQSSTDSLSFTWHVTNPEQVRHIRIQPVRGTVQSHESLPIKVTFMAVEAPAFHDIDLVCEIYNETIFRQYEQDLKRWERNIQERWERFEINDEEYEACLRGGILDLNENVEVSTKQNQFRQGSTLQMCKTLPPVLVNYELDESNVDRSRRLRTNARRQMQARPQLPVPELLHLAFTARTLLYNEYLDSCNDTRELDKFFIDTCLGGDYRSEGVKKNSKQKGDDQLFDDDIESLDKTDEQLTVSNDEADMLRGTLSDLLRSLLCDRVFADNLPEMIAEPIPYFRQLQYTSLETRKKAQTIIDGQQQQQASQTTKNMQAPWSIAEEINLSEQEQSLTWPSAVQENVMYPIERQPQPSSSESSSFAIDQKLQADEIDRLKNNPNVTSIIEDILENTVWNILQEAFHNEFSLTARPRLIALPPKRQRQQQPQASLSTQSSFQQMDTSQTRLPAPLIMTESFD